MKKLPPLLLAVLVLAFLIGLNVSAVSKNAADDNDKANSTAAEDGWHVQPDAEERGWTSSVAAGTGHVAVKGYVSEEIYSQGYTCYVAVRDVETGDIFDVYLYRVNGYGATLSVPAGKYVLDMAGVAGDTSSRYPVTANITDIKPYSEWGGEIPYQYLLGDGSVWNLEVGFGMDVREGSLSGRELPTDPREPGDGAGQQKESQTEKEIREGVMEKMDKHEMGTNQGNGGKSFVPSILLWGVICLAIGGAIVWLKRKEKPDME